MAIQATITSKKQFTIPAELFYKLDYSAGEVVSVREEGGILMIEKNQKVHNDLDGILANDIPKRFKGLTPDEIIEKAKQEYFAKNNA